MSKKRSQQTLSAKDINKRIKALTLWSINPKKTQLSKTFEFPTFLDALSFVAKVSVHAEVLGHHPDIELSYGRVKIKLTTHDAKGLTRADFELAKRIDKMTA